MNCSNLLQDIDHQTTFWIFLVHNVITIAGLTGNLAAFIVIFKHSKQDSVTYQMIGYLMASDFVALIARYFSTWQLVIFGMETSVGTFIRITILDTIALTTNINSTLHVTLLVCLRYCLLCHPLWSRRCISRGRCLYASVGAWSFSVVLGLLYFLLYYRFVYGDLVTAVVKVANLMLFVLLVLIPCTLMVVFHILTVIKLKKSLIRNTHATRKLTLLTAVIVIVQFISQAPTFYVLIIGIHITNRHLSVITFTCQLIIVAVISAFSLTIIHSVNSLIYFAMMPLAKTVFKCCVPLKRRFERRAANSFVMKQSSVQQPTSSAERGM